MQLSGFIKKMQTSIDKGVAKYALPIGDKLLVLDDIIGKDIKLVFNGNISCMNCGRFSKKSYSQGFCYPCARRLACCDLCIMRPHTCHYHLNTCRQPQWGLDNCFQPHIVYLANSSNIKVGITRKINIPQRWIDQGATSALPILECHSRLQSGQLEVALKQFISDRTDWRKMLGGDACDVDLIAVRDRLLPKITKLIQELDIKRINSNVVTIKYLVLKYPVKVKSLNFDKTPVIEGVLQGIKGQYLILNHGVLNIRKFSSYDINLSYS